MLWMPHILFVIFGIVALVPEWRHTALIICAASFANMLYQPLLEEVAATGDQRVLIVHAVAESITILALLAWGSKGKFLQISVLILFIGWNLALAIDYLAPPYPIYESYMGVIFALNIIQILLVSGGIHALVRSSIKFVLARTTRPLLGRIWHSYSDSGGSGPDVIQHWNKG